MKEALTVMIAMFCQMGLETNLEKSKAMVCTPGLIWGKVGEMDYKRQVTGEGEISRERKKSGVSCAMCGVMMVSSYLKENMSRSHGICVPQTRGVDEVGGGTTTYVVSFPKVLQEVRYPVPGCPAVAHSAGRLRKHFMFCHFRSMVAVVQ